MYQYQGWTQMQRQTPKLPPGWEVKWDPNTSRWFYINHITKKTQWEPPTQETAGPAQTTTSFIHADPEKTKLLLKEYENVTEDYIKTVLRIHQNNLSSVRSTLASRGIKKRPQVHPKSHFVLTLKKQFPSAPEDVIKELLVSTSNNFVGARTSLESMGFKRVYETEVQQKPQTVKKPAKPAASTLKPNVRVEESSSASVSPKKLSESEKEKRLKAMRKKFPDIDKSLIELSLIGTEYDITLAATVLQSSLDSVSRKQSKASEPSEPRGDLYTPVPTSKLEPVIFGADEDRREQTPASSESGEFWRKTRPQPQNVRSYEAVKTVRVTCPKVTPVRRQHARAYASKSSVTSVGPDPSLCNGPNHSLLLKERIWSMGPDRSLRQGPQKQNRCGPLRSNAKGRAHINAGPAGAVGPAMLVV